MVIYDYVAQLRNIVKQYGIPTPDLTPRFKSLLQDVFVDHPREMNLLIAGLEEGIPRQFHEKNGVVPYGILSGQLINQLEIIRGMNRDAATWVVKTWAEALGYDIPECNISPQKNHVEYVTTAPITEQIEREISAKESKREFNSSVDHKSNQGNSNGMMIALGILGLIIAVIIIFAISAGFSSGSSYNNQPESLSMQPISTNTNSIPVWIECDKSQMIHRGEEFSTTIKGIPFEMYVIWVQRTGDMSCKPGDQPPLIMANQDNVWHDSPDDPVKIGGYQYQGGAGKCISQDVPGFPEYQTKCYALIELDSNGLQTIRWTTSQDTGGERWYSIRVERKFGNQYDYFTRGIWVQ